MTNRCFGDVRVLTEILGILPATKFYDFVIAAAIADGVGKRGGGRAVSRNQIYVHAQRSNFNHIAVEERPIHMGRWVARWSALSAPSAGGSRRRRDRRRIEHPVLDIWHFAKTGHQWRAGLLLHVRGTTRLVSVIMIHKDRFDIGHFEAHAFDILL